MGDLDGCAGAGQPLQPAWIDGVSEEFHPDRFLAGLGQAESRPAATKRAYAAVARVFKAEISAQARDWESYILLENRSRTTHERRLTVDQMTQVSTDKVLENVRILDGWFDEKTGIHYALAGMDRVQAGNAFLERITELDGKIETELHEARETPDPLAKIKNFKRAAAHLVLREAYNADLRVIRSSGRGHPSAYRVAELTANLEQYLAANLLIGVEVTGTQAESTRRAVMEGLIREGLPVTDRPLGSEDLKDETTEVRPLLLLVKGSVQLWKAEVQDPLFRYVRWCSDFIIVEPASGRLVGAVSGRGREGHISDQEAMTRAVRVMHQDVTVELAKTLADYVYGETSQPADVTPPAVCPREKDRLIFGSVPFNHLYL